MHPVIRIASFLLLIIGLAVAIETFMLLLPFLLLLFNRFCTFSSVLPLLKRLRWLLLSLFILHLWFSGTELTGLPTVFGFITAVKQTTALVIMVLAAHVLMSTTPLNELIAALQWWFTPLSNPYFSFNRLAVRLALVLETVKTVQELEMTHSNTATRISTWVRQVMTQAEHAPLRSLDIPQLPSPPGWQWRYPVFILLLILIS